ncbi:MAG: 50S ribosomal protein L18 [Candidatus Saccharimonadales bacterium]
MNSLVLKLKNRTLRKNRIRSTIQGTADRPRLSVHISSRHISAQMIDDDAHRTLIAVSTVGQKSTGTTMTDKAAWTGAEIAKKAKASKISKIVFDRGGRKYHGRVKALAEAARQEGLEF